MGAGSSKPEPPQSTHIFAADTPVSFSSDLIESLQNNPESDSTRARTRDLHVQERVHEELDKLHQSVSQTLTETYQKISAEEPTDASSSPKSSTSTSVLSQLTSDSPSQPSITSRITDAITGSDKRKEVSLSHDALAKEIEELKRKLEARKKLVEADKGVENAKNDVVACLRRNEKRPLDCWREVEVFKREVGRLEEEFIEKAVR